MKLIMCLSLVLFSVLSSPAHAQFNTSSITQPQLEIVLEPEFPEPGEIITASLNDYAGGVYGSTVVWSLDGVKIPESTNQRKTSLTAGSAGETQNLTITLLKPGGGSSVITKDITPVYLDIIIEPQTRVPTFYQGRALPSLGSMVNATALINGDGVNTNNFVYTWTIGRVVIDQGPLRGRNKVSYTTPMGKSAVMSLKVTNLQGETVARKSILIPSVTPTISFYEVSALLGTNNQDISNNFYLSGDSTSILAEPYNLDLRVYNEPDIHTWSVDGYKSYYEGGNPYEVNIQRVEGYKRSFLEFHVRDTTQILQGAKNTIVINF